ncbi:ethylene-responsive transcription factor ERF019-like [Cynara cardunculus var. scolymus]|uniref:AP2/ERF domain-containing protein n=1 Tax=Cynara cardunculus var. scolymus TaxID=59895 RepID=A0A103GWB9_CYNCS|nr:ethylene-responsive transcription factor ERF019-like [Cynara cardunculus var. scolymus]KVE79004.1 AP2/ERF domain-containing protein [Cynara cardunculus var. scolymus]
MSTSSDEGCSTNQEQKRYKGIRCRRWGKWVSEIRVPGTQDRLWLGTYTTPEGAAMAQDVASYCLRGAVSLHKLNFPNMLPPTARIDLSPRSVQKAASDAGMAMDARLIASRETTTVNYDDRSAKEGEGLSISVDDYL